MSSVCLHVFMSPVYFLLHFSWILFYLYLQSTKLIYFILPKQQFKKPFNSIWFHNSYIFSCAFTLSLFCMPNTNLLLCPSTDTDGSCPSSQLLHSQAPQHPWLIQSCLPHPSTKIVLLFPCLSTSIFSLNSSTAILPSYHQTWIKMKCYISLQPYLILLKARQINK